MARELLQGIWRPELAKRCVGDVGVPRTVALDCVANSFAGLGFLTREQADELSRHLNGRHTGVDPNDTAGYLGNLLKLDIELFELNKNNVKSYLVANLRPGYSTILDYGRIDRTGHSVVVRKDMWNNLFINDIQQNTRYSFDEHFSRIDPNANIFFIYRSEPLRENAMDIDPDLISSINRRANERDRIARAQRIFALPPTSSRSLSLLRPKSSMTKYSLSPSLSRRMKKGGKTKKRRSSTTKRRSSTTKRRSKKSRK
jgi:hypothetical protein